MNEITCISCGCTDSEACEGGCYWMREDAEGGAGVCSNCPEFVEAFDAGDRGEGLIERRAGELILPGDPEFYL